MLIEIILAFVIAMGITYFMFELIIKIKNKNDDLLVKTLVSTDQAIITNKLMKYAIDEKKDFNCNVKVEGKVVTYNDEVITIISEYADVGTVDCNNNNNMVTISIPVSVKQLKDNFNVSVNYRYGEADSVKPTCSLSINSSGRINASYSDNEGGSGISYYGWSSSYSDDVSDYKDISGVGTYTYHVKDYAGNTGSCSVTVVGTDTESVVCPYFGQPSTGCYSSSYNGTCKTATWLCDAGTDGVDDGTMAGDCLKAPFGCNNGQILSRTYKCDNGGSLGGNGRTCYVWNTPVRDYPCPSGYSNKINDSYCYKVN